MEIQVRLRAQGVAGGSSQRPVERGRNCVERNRLNRAPVSRGPLPKRPCTERVDAPLPPRRPREAYPWRYGEGGQRRRGGCSGPRMPGSSGNGSLEAGEPVRGMVSCPGLSWRRIGASSDLRDGALPGEQPENPSGNRGGHLRDGIQLARIQPHSVAPRALVHLDALVIDLDQVHAALGALPVMKVPESFFLFLRQLLLLLPLDLLAPLELDAREIFLFALAWLPRHRSPPFRLFSRRPTSTASPVSTYQRNPRTGMFQAPERISMYPRTCSRYISSCPSSRRPVLKSTTQCSPGAIPLPFAASPRNRTTRSARSSRDHPPRNESIGNSVPTISASRSSRRSLLAWICAQRVRHLASSPSPQATGRGREGGHCAPTGGAASRARGALSPNRLAAARS